MIMRRYDSRILAAEKYLSRTFQHFFIIFFGNKKPAEEGGLNPARLGG